MISCGARRSDKYPMRKVGGIAVLPDETGIDVKDEINAFDPVCYPQGLWSNAGMCGRHQWR